MKYSGVTATSTIPANDPSRMIQAAAEQDGRQTVGAADDGLADVEQTGVALRVQAKIFAIRDAERLEGLVAGNDVALGVGDAQHHASAAALDQAFPDESRQIDRAVLFEFVLDQQRHPIEILDRPLGVLRELRSERFGVVRRSADQRVLGCPQLDPRRRPHAGDKQQAERGQRP